MTSKLLAATLCGICTVSSVHAKEGGDQYANGAENWFAGAVPPPGNYFLNYFGHVSGKLRDNDGHKVRAPNGKDIELNAIFDALRFIKVTETQVLGANYGWAAILPIVDLSIDVAGSKHGRTGIGDATITPLLLSWHSPKWHYAVGLDINLPTGAFDENDPPGKNIGANYYSVEPVFGVTYLNKDGWEVSGKFMYNWKTKNDDTHYQSGDEFHMDFLVGKHFGPWSVGVSGYYLKQLTDDKLHGDKVGPDGNRGQVFAVGPSIKYETAGKSHLIFQWQHESNVENRFQGDKLWFKLITAL
ncbi:SphA family protein [Aromatoleum anaerobium]|uniref:Phenol degradation protein meta n=1 Tax=Aromatoleum anaerobium TaxID=182180 RepID=A0N0T8_9RHOO|nr:transporter [Aromatoleum anaerobium]ABK58616.1 putative resorcinol degradation regulation protein [Aromatoleum anaerobium]MCK0505385.1 transporter [Aromatoleum anaerobium]